MRSKLLVAILLLCSFAVKAQWDCSKIRNGSFKQADEGRGEMLITRKGNTQIEENLKTGVKITLEIVWTGDCTYELKNMKVLKGKLPFSVPEGTVVYNEVLEVNNKTVRVKCWSSIAPDNIMEFSFQIL